MDYFSPRNNWSCSMAFDDIKAYNDMINKDRIRAIMQAQAEIESSGGRNVDHPEINYKSMHKGTSAKGRYGIMPLTLRDLAQGMTRDKEAQEAASIEDEQALKDYFASHPALEDRLAMQYIEHANKSMGGDYDPEKITYAWQWGQNKTPKDYEEHKNDPEVQKRWARVKGMFKDPHPPMLPAGKAKEESAFAGLKTPTVEEVTPTPVANMSPQEEIQASIPEVEVPVEENNLSKILSPKREQQVVRETPKAEPNSFKSTPIEQPEEILAPSKMRQLMSLMSVRRK